jgi:hypothetical protein
MSDQMEFIKLVRSAEVSLTGKRFCASCQTMQSAELGAMTKGKRVNRWQCYNCNKRISKRLYQKKGQDDA